MFFSCFILLLKCPCVKLCFWFHTTFFPVILCSFLYTHTHTHCDTQHTFCDCKSGSPWRRDHSDATHDLWVSAHFIDTHRHTCFFTLFFCWLFFLSDFQYHVSVIHDAQHINTTKPTTIVLVYKYIPFFQHEVYTYFLSGWYFICCSTSCWYNPGKITATSPPSHPPPPQRRVL